MALDDASYGLVRPSTEVLRRRMGNEREATNPDQWKVAIDSFADRFAALGLQPPRTIDHYIAFTSIDNEAIVDLIANEIAPRFPN
jgi:hypothetical protein